VPFGRLSIGLTRIAYLVIYRIATTAALERARMPALRFCVHPKLV
jgi:hypothetical protein